MKNKELSKMKKNWILFRIYFLTSLFTFTGGLAMMTTLKKSICDKHKLMSEKDFLNYATLSQTLPGVIAIHNACFVGKKVNGVSGMIIASISTIIPAFVFMLLGTILFELLPKEDGAVFYALAAVRAISASFIFSAAFTIARHNLKNVNNILLAIICFSFAVLNLIDTVYLIIFAIIFGLIITLFGRKKEWYEC